MTPVPFDMIALIIEFVRNIEREIRHDSARLARCHRYATRIWWEGDAAAQKEAGASK
jgi:hypothetical protein